MIKNKRQYHAIEDRVNQLLELVHENTATDDPQLIELDLLSECMAAYEEKAIPVKTPPLTEVIKLKMYERGITQAQLSKMLGISNSRISEYLSGKSEPTLKIARKISQSLQIEPSIILGV